MVAGSVFVRRKCVVREVGLARGNQYGGKVSWWERNGSPREGNDDGKVISRKGNDDREGNLLLSM